METVEQKFATAKQHKENGDAAFKAGDLKKALFAYNTSLMYLNGLDKSALQSLGMSATPAPSTATGSAKEKTEIDDILEKVYANMSACHLKNGNWKRALETADKALSKNPDNTKAMFRKGKALGEQGFLDKALSVLEDLKKKSPGEDAMVDAEVARLRKIDNERSKAANKKLRGFLNKSDKTLGIEEDNRVTEVKSGLVEVDEDEEPIASSSRS